jgi:acyl-CoA thioesterase I
VAVGASDTAGVGADDPVRQSWPAVLHRRTLDGAEYVNLGVSGSTVAQAVRDQLPAAVAAEPDVATVWLAVNDVLSLVPVATYERQLATLVSELRRGGRTTVLVGNVPALERLPAVRACLAGASSDAAAGGPQCRLPVVLTVADVRRVVAGYNAAVARVAAASGAVLVDLSQEQDVAGLTSSDGFHPSTAGHRRIAREFAARLTG